MNIFIEKNRTHLWVVSFEDPCRVLLFLRKRDPSNQTKRSTRPVPSWKQSIQPIGRAAVAGDEYRVCWVTCSPNHNPFRYTKTWITFSCRQICVVYLKQCHITTHIQHHLTWNLRPPFCSQWPLCALMAQLQCRLMERFFMMGSMLTQHDIFAFAWTCTLSLYNSFYDCQKEYGLKASLLSIYPVWEPLLSAVNNLATARMRE